MLNDTEQLAINYNKPFMVTEFGGDWSASSREGLDGDFLVGLWWGWMSRSAGVPFYWWYDYIALEANGKSSFYTYYAAFSRFIEGEDKRRGRGERPLRSNWPITVGPDSDSLGLLQLGDGKTFYAWVFNSNQIQYLPSNARQHNRHKGKILTIAGVEPGMYRVEAWDSWTGKVINTSIRKQKERGPLAIPLPEFRVHLAVKVKPLDTKSKPMMQPETSREKKDAPPKETSAPETSAPATRRAR
jgi:hypothetical protein